MHLESIIQLNNEVVSLMYRKEFHRALEISSFTMQEFQALGLTASEEQVVAAADNGTNNEVDQCILKRTKISKDCYDDTSSSEYIYEQGICLPSNATDPTVITPILIFNSALCHHLTSLHYYYYAGYTSMSQRMLQKARNLYMLAYNDQGDSYNSLFKLVITNNVGGVYTRLGNEEQAKECLDCLVSSMMFLRDLGCLEELQHIQGCWMNIYTVAKIAPAA